MVITIKTSGLHNYHIKHSKPEAAKGEKLEEDRVWNQVVNSWETNSGTQVSGLLHGTVVEVGQASSADRRMDRWIERLQQAELTEGPFWENLPEPLGKPSFG